MIQAFCPVHHVEQVADNIFVLTFISPEISKQVSAGQFINIKTEIGCEPLLRRPYSVYRAEKDAVEVIFNVVGKGSTVLRKRQSGDMIDVLGPLGVPFSLNDDDFDTAVLVGGGLGIAPLPISTKALLRNGKSVQTFLGARSSNHLVENHLENIHISTDDGTKGYHGNVVDFLRGEHALLRDQRLKIFACGPTKMLQSLAAFALRENIPCEVSLEGPMACGFGICQGCPVELIGGEKKYGLMCKDGPTFDVRTIRI